MENTEFLWRWESYAPQPDSLMTRARAARLLKAWRGGSRRPVNGRPTYRLQRVPAADGWRVYCVESKHGETGEMWIRAAGKESE